MPIAPELIEVSGTPPLEGKEGFYGSYLRLLDSIYSTMARIGDTESGKNAIIGLIEIGIAVIPDPKSERIKELGLTRDEIYKKIDDYYNDECDRVEEEKKKLSTEQERDILYRAYVRKGLGSMSSWYDHVVGSVTPNIVSRTGPRRGK
jgi:hypothetical protein